MKTILSFLTFVLAGIFIAQAEPVKIELPLETAVYKEAPGADLANAQCLTCHSAEYISTQPLMPRAFWKGSIDKMIGKYGAPVPAEQIEALADYLAKNYGSDATNTAIASTPVNEIPTPASGDVKQLMQKSGCFNCHMMDKKFIGPAFKDVAGKYKGNSEAFAKVSHQITHGGSGLWGPIPMPPFKQFSESEIKTVSAWILEQ